MAETNKTDAIQRFSVGEDVMYRGRRYTVSQVLEGPYSLRLLATDEPGTAFVHAVPGEVERIIDEDGELKTRL